LRILVKHVDAGAGGDVRISFVSSAGEGVATWRGEVQPLAGRQYGVELDLDFVLDKTMCQKPDDRTPSVQVRPEGTLLRVLVERVDEDDVIYLRLADDCLFLAESTGGFAEGDVVQLLLSPEQLVTTLIGV
jgi:hypothetical protein